MALQEQILRYGSDSEVRNATQFNICFAYRKLGEHDKALAQAKKLPNLYKARENALLCFLDGEEKRVVAEEALLPLAWTALHLLNALAETKNDPAYAQRAARILELLAEGEEAEPADAIRDLIPKI